jgi:uncharacterized protein (DUF4415 family)
MTIVRTKASDLPTVSAQRLAELSELAKAEPDFSDIPELDADFWNNAQFVTAKPSKVPVALRLNPETLAWFKAQGEGHTTKMAAILQHYYEHAKQV